MKSKIRYILIRLAIFLVLGLFLMLIPMRHDQVMGPVFVNIEQRIWIMAWATIFAGIWILGAFLFLRVDRKKVMQEAEEVIKNLEGTEKWKTLRGTLQELHEKSRHLEDCRNKILQWESDERYIVRIIPYLEGEWKTKSLAPSFMSSEFNSWARDLDVLKKCITKIVEPYSLLDILNKLEIERQEWDTKVRAMLDRIDNQPFKFASVLKAETTRIRDYLDEFSTSYENVRTLERKLQVVSEMKDLIEQIEIVQRLAKLLSGESDIMEYERGICVNKNEALLFRMCYAISQANQQEVGA